MAMEGVAKETLLDVADHLSCGLPCKVCIAKGKDSAPRAGCWFCIAKASALDRIKAAGGDIVEAAAAAAEKSKTKPFTVVTASCLEKMEAAGGRVVKTAVKEGGVGKVVTVRLSDAYVKDLMSLPLPPPLPPLSEDFFHKHPNLREATRVGTAAILYTIAKEENIYAQFFEKGYVVVDFEVVEQEVYRWKKSRKK